MDFFLHHDMKNLPMVLDRGLKDLRRLDESSRIAIESLATQELDLFEEIQRLAKEDPNFDEAPLIEKYQSLLSQRLGAQSKLDDQIKRAQKLYDIVDGRITFVGINFKDLLRMNNCRLDGSFYFYSTDRFLRQRLGAFNARQW